MHIIIKLPNHEETQEARCGVHASVPSTWEAEAEGSQVREQPKLYSDFGDIWSYKGCGCRLVVEYLPSMLRILGSIPSMGGK